MENETQLSARTRFLHRFKSPVVWCSLAAVIGFVAKSIWGKNIDESLDGFLNVFLPFMAALGIMNNPTDPDKI